MCRHFQALHSPLPSNQTSALFIHGRRPSWSVHSGSLDPHQRLVLQQIHTYTFSSYALKVEIYRENDASKLS